MEDFGGALAVGLFIGIGLAIFSRIHAWRRLKHAMANFDIAELTKLGWRIETQTDDEVVIVRSRRVNHVLHLILTLITLGSWAIVWIVLAIFGGEKRRSFLKPRISAGRMKRDSLIHPRERRPLPSETPALEEGSDNKD